MRILFTILPIATALVSSPLLGQSAPQLSDKTNFTEENTMGSHELVQKPSILVIGIDCRTSNAPEAGPQDIPKLWGRFYGEDILSRIPNKTSNEVIALYCDYESDYTQPYSVVIGSPVSSVDIIPEGMVAKTIPASSYAVFRAIGEHPKTLIESCKKTRSPYWSICHYRQWSDRHSKFKGNRRYRYYCNCRFIERSCFKIWYN